MPPIAGTRWGGFVAGGRGRKFGPRVQYSTHAGAVLSFLNLPGLHLVSVRARGERTREKILRTPNIFFCMLFCSFIPLGTKSATAQDGCSGNDGLTDLCQNAQLISGELADLLPLQISSDMTLAGVIAIENAVIFRVLWPSTHDDLERRLVSNGMSWAGVQSDLQNFTQNAVCSQSVLTRFVLLGGEVEYIYQSSDGVRIASPIVVSCLN